MSSNLLPKGNNLSFTDQICIITGSARGLGKSHALAFAACGAFVVIHDVDEKAAKETADYINKTFPTNATYPRAIPCIHSMTNPEGPPRIIQDALKSFSPQAKLTMLVNNAGILRDKSFANMSEQQWDQIYQVHLHGVFLMTRAAWNVFKTQKYGRVIFTTSAAGLFGNFGQANYGACKEALCGLARTLAIESDRIGDVCVNCVSPLAGTQILQQSNVDKDWLDALKVEIVSPLVLFLCSSKCKENGQIYEVGGGVITKVRYERGIPFYCDTIEDALNTELIEKNWSKINSFYSVNGPVDEDSGYVRNPSSAAESFQNIIKHATNIAKNQATRKVSSSETAPVQQSSAAPSKQGKKVVAGLTRAEQPSEVNIEGYQCSEIFGRMISLFKEHSDLTQKYKVTYVFDLINNSNKTIKKQWTLNMKNGEDCGVYMGVPESKEGEKVIDCTMTMTDATCYKIMSGKLAPQTAFMTGSVKVKGNIGLALKLVNLQKLLNQNNQKPSKL
ncbi:short chain dehydrogenase/reductase [Naegleria gruberi]|uniref:Short chain dehydrogenase/reductase n=1 Tax=Naegleria gruberi TaxID=5762 RepID=D2VF59_NAEGR|nr:short chain dehydrogenase/reductase [Naegleria gruberi]EFC44717.1 short chain dehydrogenase/reductase [Naegleria gruberi]|eukprot:XP_002677461.1 short chain dehydrogenase/reductase [Naegleria gruberi strain NEG-M]